MANYEAAAVRCPFYKRSGRKGCYIRCEGIGNARSVKLTYRSERQRAKQLEAFCRGCFEACEIYRAIIDRKQQGTNCVEFLDGQENR